MPSTMKPKIDLSKMQDLRCECQCPLWVQASVIKIIPGLLVGEKAPTFYPVPQDFVCVACRKPLTVHLQQLQSPVKKGDA